MDLDVTWGNSRGAGPLVVHCWADLQSVHGFRCYDSIAPNTKCQRVLVLALCLVVTVYAGLPYFEINKYNRMRYRSLQKEKEK